MPESSTARSRRAILGGVAAGAAALIATILGRPQHARAGVDGDLVLNQGNATLSPTGITGSSFYINASTGSSQTALDVFQDYLPGGNNWGIYVNSLSGQAVGAYGQSYGVEATGEWAGVHGESSIGRGVIGRATGEGNVAGVRGEYSGTSSTAVGVEGIIENAGVAVRGDAPKLAVLGTVNQGGVGVFGYSQAGTGYPSPIDSHIPDNIGVAGESNTVGGSGVFGYTTYGTGVYGRAGASTPSPKPSTGVFGYAANSTSARGVWGESTAGIGVYGRATTGFAGYFQGKVFTSSFHELIEITTPAAPGANRARLFVRDVGGKTQLCVRFATGSVKLLAQEA